MKREEIGFFLLLITAIFTVIPGALSAYEFSKKASSPERATLLAALAGCFLVPTVVLIWRTKVAHRLLTWAASMSRRAQGFIEEHPLFAASLAAVCLLLYLLERQIQSVAATAIATGLVIATVCLALGAGRLILTTRRSFLGLPRLPEEPWRFDFIDHFDDPSTTKSCGQPWEIQVKQEAHSVGIVKRAIFEHPPAAGKTVLTYMVEQLPHDLGELQLEFFVGVLDEGFDEKTGVLQETSRFDTVQGNRITFEIWVNEGLVFLEERDSVGWSEFKSVSPVVPIENRLIVSFRTDAMGHPEWNWAAWGEPRLTRLRAKSSAPA